MNSRIKSTSYAISRGVRIYAKVMSLFNYLHDHSTENRVGGCNPNPDEDSAVKLLNAIVALSYSECIIVP
jgi:hypothetical protein